MRFCMEVVISRCFAIKTWGHAARLFVLCCWVVPLSHNLVAGLCSAAFGGKASLCFCVGDLCSACFVVVNTKGEMLPIFYFALF